MERVLTRQAAADLTEKLKKDGEKSGVHKRVF